MAHGGSWRVSGEGGAEGGGSRGRAARLIPSRSVVRPQPPRPCEDYWWEWKHCRGLRHAFHHYYAHGELPTCGRWREDYEACRAWEKGRAAAAQEALCKSERARVMENQKYAPVWTLRKNPPPDWYLPLDQDKPN
ncbi:synaptic plasticity regulator PANTS [Guaruba guarouba]